MRLPKCPRQEHLLECVSIPEEVPVLRRLRVRFHAFFCHRCQQAITSIQQKLDNYFLPETDITSSLLNVYSRLQNDETLMLKGWKLDAMKKASPVAPPRVLTVLSNNWFFVVQSQPRRRS